MISSNQEMSDRSNYLDSIIHGDCRQVLHSIPNGAIGLIVTSPPYADARQSVYGGVHPNKYVEWFLPIGAELFRVLRDDGSFILNIKERVVDGERHTYVLDLIKALRNQGWLWTEEYIWHKRNCAPGKWPNRFRDAWERCLHFTRSKNFIMNQDAVRVPMGDWANARLKNLSETDQRRDNSRVGSKFGKNVSKWVGREMAYPTNVLHLATECANRAHAATFPKSLPAWFIQLFSKPTSVVLDPFAGSGTTCLAARDLGRPYVGIELSEEYYKLALANLRSTHRPLMLLG